MTCCAWSWRLQNPGSAICCSISESCSSRRAPSKIPPEFYGPPFKIFVSPHEVVECDRHIYLLIAMSARAVTPMAA
jgi:hypothetical protein